MFCDSYSPSLQKRASGVCLVRTTEGTGSGFLVQMEGVGICLLTAQHLLPSPDASKHCRVHLCASLNFGEHSSEASNIDPRGPRVRLHPEALFISSGAPGLGQRPTRLRLDYTLVKCSIGSNLAPHPISLTHIHNELARPILQGDTVLILRHALADAPATSGLGPTPRSPPSTSGDEPIHLRRDTNETPVCLRSDTNVTPVCLRSDANVPPVCQSKAGTLNAPFVGTSGSISRITREYCKYNAQTASGTSGAPVLLQVEGLPLVAMHRAGAPGQPGEGVLISALLRDIGYAIKRSKKR